LNNSNVCVPLCRDSSTHATWARNRRRLDERRQHGGDKELQGVGAASGLKRPGILRDYIKATVGFEKLGEATDTPSKSLIRMFGPRGNPQARNLFGVIGYLQKQAGVEFRVTPEPR
jgi:hypothetical protein